MACVLYRRLPQAIFRSATFSTTKWIRSEPRNKHGWSTLKHSKSSTSFKEANQDAVGHQENCAMYNSTPFATNMVANQKKTDENRTFSDVYYPLSISEPHKNSSTSRSQESPKRTFGNISDPHSPKIRLRKMSKAPKKFRIYDDIETFSSMDDPRAFQKQRPEYKSVSYNSERLMETSMEEAEMLLQKVSGSLTPSEISFSLEKLSFLPEKHLADTKSDPRFKRLCGCSTLNLPLYTNLELICILGALVRLSLPTNVPMLKDYEQEFARRVGQFSSNELLLVADMFRCMRFGVPKFLNEMYSCMQERCSNLTLVQAIQLIYIVGEGRHVPRDLLEKLEALFMNYLPSINLEEIGVVCLGFFKTSNGLSEHFMRQLGDILLENTEQLSNYALVNVLKMFRFTRVDHIDFFQRVGTVAPKRIPEMGSQGIMHVVLAFASMHVLHEEMMAAVAQTMPDRVSYCRSKDLAKFLWSFGVLKYEPPKADVFYSAFINQIRKNLEEFKRYPEHFLTCLMGLAFCQQFPLDLIDIALSEEFIMRSTKISMFELKKDLFTIAGSVEIECPQYSGNKISQEFRKDVTEMLAELSTRDIHVKAEVIEATTLLQYALGGPEYVKEHMILPHTRSKDLEVHLDVDKKPLPINFSVAKTDQPLQKLRNVTITDDLLDQLTNATKEGSGLVRETLGPNSMESGRKSCDHKPDGQADIVKLAIQVTNRNQYLYGSKQLLGLHSLKRRQLHKLGYVVVEVPYWEWFPLAKRTRAEKLAYLRHKVFECV
ncbi:FAST kinase domain-containing protein 5, mitochondrial [Gastrophryne carolinensis]